MIPLNTFDQADDNLQDDKLHEECGVVGIFSQEAEEIAWQVYLGLFALQHRGQEAAGICVSDGDTVLIEKDLGLVTQVFDETRLEKLRLPGTRIGIGHTRYSTTGANLRFNAQPLTVRSSKGIIALAHNGNFVNARELRDQMLEDGTVFQTTNDTEVMINLIARHARLDLIDAAAKAMRELEGGFSVVLMDRQKLVGLRDAHGVRPLVIGKTETGYIFASEPVALTAMNAQFVRDVLPGELVWADSTGLHQQQVLESKPTPCAFEWIYFARADSQLDGTDVHAARVRMGEILAREAPAEADIVVPVPDSGIGAAVGYARASGIPYEQGLYKNPYVGRTFIAPTAQARALKVRMKLAATAAVRGKRVVLVDDSLVRGTTSSHIIGMLRDAGASEVHFRLSSPPIQHPCFYGIDTTARKELIASTHTLEEIRLQIGADSLAFLSEQGVRDAVKLNNVCLACFNGLYPAGVPGAQTGKLIFE